MNLVMVDAFDQTHRFYQTFFQGGTVTIHFNYEWLVGNQLSGFVV
ncbi:hypothetical protein [Paenibacillus shirakamiensis]|nr:hypothetical protein [Paenibacillus shirakamiensis]